MSKKFSPNDVLKVTGIPEGALLTAACVQVEYLDPASGETHLYTCRDTDAPAWRQLGMIKAHEGELEHTLREWYEEGDEDDD